MQHRNDTDDARLGYVEDFVRKSARQCLPVLPMNNGIRLRVIGYVSEAMLDFV
jgi:hypothetical protein